MDKVAACRSSYNLFDENKVPINSCGEYIKSGPCSGSFLWTCPFELRYITIFNLGVRTAGFNSVF